MPSCITHQLIAEEAKDAFPNEVGKAVENNEDYFFLGTQGPDSLFFVKPLSKKEFNFGRLLHRSGVFTVFDFFRRYLERCEGEERERLTAYLAGYVCHYGADLAFHPFVYAFLERHPRAGMQHQLIETDWDVYFARIHGKMPVGWEFPFSPKKINREGTLYRLYSALSETLERRPLKEGSFARGMKNFSRYLRFFHRTSHAHGWTRTERFLHLKPRLSCIYPRETPNHEYLGGKEFLSLSGGRGRDADELYERAVLESIRLCRMFFSDEPLSRSEFNKSFLTAEEL